MVSKNSIYPTRKEFLLLCSILLLAFTFRLYGINWDEGTHLHPDERYMTMVATAIKWPQSVSEYLDPKTSPLNPYNHEYNAYIYGTFPLFLTKGIAILRHLDDYGHVHIVGRFLSSLFDLGNILLVYLLGKKLYNTKVGILAAILLSFTTLHIQQSHFFTVDAPLVFFTLLTFTSAMRIVEAAGWRNFLFTGISLGFALACKISAGFLLLIIGVTTLIAFLRESRLTDWKKIFPWTTDKFKFVIRKLAFFTFYFLLFTFFSYLTFRLLQPCAFSSGNFLNLNLNQTWWQALSFQRQAMAGEAIYPPQYQWFERTPLWFPLKNMIVWGMGIPLGITTWAGIMFMLWESIKKRTARHLPLLLWVLFNFFYIGTGFVKSQRYLLPIYPFVILGGAYFLAKIRKSRAATIFRIVIIASTLLYALSYLSIYQKPTTRVAASRWIFENLPSGSRIANEEWDDPLPMRVKGIEEVQKEFNIFLISVYAADNEWKLNHLYENLVKADYLVLSSNRAYGSIGRLPEKFPIMSKYYQLLFGEKLGFEKIAEFSSYPTIPILNIPIPDDSAEETFTVYDHPKVIIYKKTKPYDQVHFRQLFSKEVNL